MLTISPPEGAPWPDVTPIDRDNCWTSSVIVGLAFAAVALFYSLFLAGWIYNGSFWMAPYDGWMVVDGGRFVWHGALGYVYQGTGSYALPLSFVVMAPISGLVDHFGLIEGFPRPVAHPSAWLLVGPYSLLFGIFLLHAVRRLAWELGVRTRLCVLQVLASVIVLAPAYYWGHFEDMLALTFVIHAVRRLIANDFVRAALLLSVAVSFKQSAVALVPLLVFMAPRGKRLRCLVAACALPGAFVAFVLGVDWSDASKDLLSPANLLTGYQGHAALYVTWLGTKTSEISRTCGLLLSCYAGWRFRRVTSVPQLLAAVSAILLIRPLSEAINYSYYWSPCLLAAGFVGLAVHRRVRWRDWIWPVFATVWASPRSYGSISPWWWAGEVILIGATSVQVARNCGVQFHPPSFEGVWFKKSRKKPIVKRMSTARAAGDTSWTQ
jgi:hypothetical protein